MWDTYRRWGAHVISGSWFPTRFHLYFEFQLGLYVIYWIIFEYVFHSEDLN